MGISQVTQWVKNLPANAGDTSLIPGSVRPPWRRKRQPTPWGCLGNPMDRGAWRATVSPWGHKELDKTSQLITEPIRLSINIFE